MLAASVIPEIAEFAADVAEGLSRRQKKLSSRYFYDDLGSALFSAITLVPEYGLTRADERLLRQHGHDIRICAPDVRVLVELGSGNGNKTRHILKAMASPGTTLTYYPIDVSRAALDACQLQLQPYASVQPILADWGSGMARAGEHRIAIVQEGEARS